MHTPVFWQNQSVARIDPGKRSFPQQVIISNKVLSGLTLRQTATVVSYCVMTDTVRHVGK
jgi:hypothetical protein